MFQSPLVETGFSSGPRLFRLMAHHVPWPPRYFCFAWKTDILPVPGIAYESALPLGPSLRYRSRVVRAYLVIDSGHCKSSHEQVRSLPHVP